MSVWNDCIWISWSDDDLYESYGLLVEGPKGWSRNPQRLPEFSVPLSYPRKGLPPASWGAVYRCEKIGDGVYSFHVPNE